MDAVSYQSAHQKVRKVRGSASAQVCISCGGAAQDWALRRELLTFEHGDDRPFSLDPNDYEPLCRRCHRLQDVPEDRRREIGFAEMHQRRQEDEALDRRLREASRRAGQASTGGDALVARRAADPELDARIRATIAKNTQVWNRQCVDCGRVSTPGGMAAHLRKAGHSGQTVLPEEE